MNTIVIKPPRQTPRRMPRIAGSALIVVVVALCALLVLATPAVATQDTQLKLEDVINNIRDWIVGISVVLVILLLTFAGLRYAFASDPGDTERAKAALRAAAVGFAIIILAPVLVVILQGFFKNG